MQATPQAGTPAAHTIANRLSEVVHLDATRMEVYVVEADGG